MDKDNNKKYFGDMMNDLYFKEFKDISLKLNDIGITPVLMGSLGLEYISKVDWNAKDIDIHVNGDPRGWNAPDDLRIYNFGKILEVMSELGYELIDIHEHEFIKEGIRVQYGTIDSLYDFAKVHEKDIEIFNEDNIKFRVPNLNQFLDIYTASSKDSYRADKNNNKDFEKIDWIKNKLNK